MGTTARDALLVTSLVLCLAGMAAVLAWPSRRGATALTAAASCVLMACACLLTAMDPGWPGAAIDGLGDLVGTLTGLLHLG